MLLRFPTFNQILKLIWLISWIENRNFYPDITPMDAHGGICTREWQIWWGCGLISPHSDRIKSRVLHIHTGTDTSIPKAINTDACASATPHHTLWHTDWLIPWWARLWHTDCATLQQQRPPSPLSPSLPRPPLVSMQFLAEQPFLIPPFHLYSPFLLWRLEMRMGGRRKRTGGECVKGTVRPHSFLGSTEASFCFSHKCLISFISLAPPICTVMFFYLTFANIL